MKLRLKDVRAEKRLSGETAIAARGTPVGHEYVPAVLVGDIVVAYQAEADGGDASVWGDVRADVRLTCARCLIDTIQSISHPFETHAEPDQEFFDLAEEARQAVALGLPVKPLCREECAGLCSRCGVNLNAAACGCNEERDESPFQKLKTYKFVQGRSARPDAD